MRRLLFVGLYLLILTAASYSLVYGVELWRQSSWVGGGGQFLWADSTRYLSATNLVGHRRPGDLFLYAPDTTSWSRLCYISTIDVAYRMVEDSAGNLYLATGYNGDVLKSTDRGETWFNTGELEGAERVYALMVTPSGALYAGGSVGTYPYGEVYKSEDGGTTWDTTSNPARATSVTSLFCSRDGTIYAGRYTLDHIGRVYKTVDGGETWDTTGIMPTALGGIYDLMEAHDGTIYAATVDSGDVYKSTNAGTTWVRTAEMLTTVRWCTRLAEDTAGNIYANDDNAASDNNFYRSTDGGESWKPFYWDYSGGGGIDIMSGLDGWLYATTIREEEWVYTWWFVISKDGVHWHPPQAQPEEMYYLFQNSDGVLYTFGTRDIYACGFCPAGTLTSSVFHAQMDTVMDYGTLSWVGEDGIGSISVQVRTGSDSLMSDALPWGECPKVENGQDISGLVSVDDSACWVQYRVCLSSSSLVRSPVLQEISLEYGVSGVEPGAGEGLLPFAFDLGQNWPNPFNSTTVIRYSLIVDRPHRTTLKVYNLLGEEVRTLVEGKQRSGFYQVVWDGKNGEGEDVGSGIYFYQLKAGRFSQTRKMLLLR